MLKPRKLLKPADISDHIDKNGITHGLYGWWFDQYLPDAPRTGCLELDGRHLLYIGIAPSKERPVRSGSATPVKRRIWRNHLNGSVRTSTLRLSLAALLETQLHLEFYRDNRGRVRMPKEHEVKLSAWLDQHACISVAHHDAPWRLEEALIRNGPPLPLNLSMSHHPFKSTLSGLRRTLGRCQRDLK